MTMLAPYGRWLLLLSFIASSTGAEVLEQHGPAKLCLLEGGKRVEGKIHERLSSDLWLELVVEGSAKLRVQPPEAPTVEGGLKLVEVTPARQSISESGQQAWSLQFRFTPWKPGPARVLFSPLSYEDGGGQRVIWQPVEVEVVARVLGPDLAELRDIAPLEEVPEPDPWPWWPAWVLLALAFAAVLFVRFRIRTRLRHAPSPESLAFAQLERLAVAEITDADRFHVQVALVVRAYFERRWHLAAPRQTSREFLGAAGRQLPLSPEILESLDAFLARCDRAKFAGLAMRREECLESLRMARMLIDDCAALQSCQPSHSPS